MTTEKLAHVVDSDSGKLIARIPVDLINEHELIDKSIPSKVKNYDIICDIEDLSRYTIREGLPKLYVANNPEGKSVSKFMNSRVGCERVWAVLSDENAVPAPVIRKGVKAPQQSKVSKAAQREAVMQFFDRVHKADPNRKQAVDAAREAFPEMSFSTIRTYHFQWRIERGHSRPKYYPAIVALAKKNLTRLEAAEQLEQDLGISYGAALARINDYYAVAKRELEQGA